MTREEAISQLRELIRDRKSFLDGDEPDSVYQQDIDALEYAIDFINSHPQCGAHSWFYTFGRDPRFPHGIDDFVEVHANSRNEADEKFKANYPNRPGSDALNCAWVYGEEAWKPVYHGFYEGIKPVRVID